MLANVIGRVKHTLLPKSKALLPLFEAIVNSIDSIEDAQLKKLDGLVKITILRGPYTLPLDPDGKDRSKNRGPVIGFIIQDNGIGFTNENYSSFNEVDTLYKAHRGGQGLGRFTWLKAFNQVYIDSVFCYDGKKYRRTFSFSINSRDGIENPTLVEVEDDQEIKTSVHLLDVKKEYVDEIPSNSETIARRIVEHCLPYYFLGTFPSVILEDPEGDQTVIDLFNIYADMVQSHDQVDFEVDGHPFTLVHFLLHASSGIKHHVCYCANNRVVITESVENKISNLPSSISQDGNGEKYIFAAYVSSPFLDTRVNPLRYTFDLLPEGNLFPGELSFSQINESVVTESKKLLRDFTEGIKEKKEDEIRTFVYNEAPEYRHILKNHSEKLDVIPPDLPKSKLDIALYTIQKDILIDLKKEGEDIIESGLFEIMEYTPEKLEQFSKWWQDYNEAGKADLAKYIVNRKLILTFLEEALKKRGNGKYALEEIVHQVIFPLRTTSDDITFEKHNLWIIDEKLSYHNYLASDIKLSRNETVESDSDNRPDLFFFYEHSFTLTGEEYPYNSYVIFEFKRPGRNDYDARKNPIQQIYTYIDDIKSGKAQTKDGRQFPNVENIPIYCYVVCDITPTLVQQVKHLNFIKTPDGDGYFYFHTGYGAYIEIISFDKLVSDAKKRNRVLFEKLCLPM